MRAAIREAGAARKKQARRPWRLGGVGDLEVVIAGKRLVPGRSLGSRAAFVGCVLVFVFS